MIYRFGKSLVINVLSQQITFYILIGDQVEGSKTGKVEEFNYMYKFCEKLFTWFILALLAVIVVGIVVGGSIMIQVGLFYVIQNLAPSWIVLSDTFSYLSLFWWNVGMVIITTFFALTIIPLIALIVKNRLSKKLLWIIKQSLSFFYVYLFFYLFDYYEEGVEISFYGLLLLALTFSLLNDVLDSDTLEDRLKEIFKKENKKKSI